MLSKPKLYQIFTLMIRKPQKEAATGQFMVHLFFPFRNKYYLLMILFVHPFIYLVRICFFLLCFFFFFGRWRGGKGSISYLSYACQLSLPLQRHHTPLPTSLSLWDDAGIKDLFYQSISVNHWKSVLFYVSINTMVLLLTVYVAISVRAVQGISHRKKVSLKLCPINYLW